MSRMTKADIIENVYEKVGGFSKKEAAEIVESVFDTIKETLEHGEKIKISGFGNFVVRDKNARVGNNVVISPTGKAENMDHPLYFIRDGIVIIPKGAMIPHGTVI